MKRRNFVIKTAQAGLVVSAFGLYGCKTDKKTENKTDNLKDDLTQKQEDKSLFFKISLAQWSLHRALFDKKLDNLEFASKSRELGCEGLEYVNAFFKDKAKDMDYLKQMNQRAADAGQKNVLIMIDGEGNLADANTKKRLEGIEKHHKWVDAAHFLGCHAIRVNLAGGVNKEEAHKAAVDSLEKLSEYAAGSNINILVENHGGYSSNGDWMYNVFSDVKAKNCGTLPDFGNFCIERKDEKCIDEYDRYKGMEQLLKFAKAVSAKSYAFDAQGNETLIDYKRIMKLVKEAGYTGYVGVEYEGIDQPEEKGIELTRDLLIKVGKELS
ncbi:MAG: xylose isomerase [Flavobacteriales bacterium]|nr:MAG: xylose isomerase [Flavobacteriales bacterium]